MVKEEGRSARCPNDATYYLMNGAQLQSKVCEACAQVVTRETKFLTARPIR